MYFLHAIEACQMSAAGIFSLKKRKKKKKKKEKNQRILSLGN